ncbi:winged helix-turn-helix transcriptional regulator [Polynucleobacter sp. AP-Elch-400A-B2]|uniref:ArsR/SmtB family transcription factor n=1 Tax=Polynucleobacter sp. AP-Elch-400A-B2 TaxID=2576930 RepID=UPI001BFCE3C2|nr:winged helix-turn-helix domain-containing protein [Polynucleobacter sp. AP-Elch-400A-B2]QWE24075.1 winged helix-turn-helix transcriptional regulator [Polynucleobacter sp. AP-Elch-400A-B2]
MKASRYLPIFEALGQEARFNLFELIYQSGSKGVRPKQMIEKFGYGAGTLSFHLKKLFASELVVFKVDGRRVIY